MSSSEIPGISKPWRFVILTVPFPYFVAISMIFARESVSISPPGTLTLDAVSPLTFDTL